MIIEFFLNIIFGLLTSVLDGLSNVITLPVGLISNLSTVWGYGIYILGSDLFTLCMSSFFFWFVGRFAFSLLVFIWRLLPFT